MFCFRDSACATHAPRARGAPQAILGPERWHFARRSEEQGLATPNYSYEKRQRELAKKRKAEEKRMRKLSGKTDSPDEAGSEEGSAPDSPEAGTEPTSPPSQG